MHGNRTRSRIKENTAAQGSLAEYCPSQLLSKLQPNPLLAPLAPALALQLSSPSARRWVTALAPHPTALAPH